MSWNATRDSQDSFYEVHLELYMDYINLSYNKLHNSESDESLNKYSRDSKTTREMSWNATRDSQDSFYEVHLELYMDYINLS